MRTLRTILTGSALAASACLAAPSAHAEVLTFAPHERTITTDDGWDVTLRVDGESWNKVAPENMSGFTRTGYGNLAATVNIDGRGASALKGAQVVTGYIIGCAATLNSLTATLNASLAPSVSVEPGFPVPIVPKGQLSGSIGPSVAASISPGETKVLPLASKTLEATTAIVHLRETHVSIDGCIGPATVHSFATVTVDSKIVKDGVSVFGDPFLI